MIDISNIKHNPVQWQFLLIVLSRNETSVGHICLYKQILEY